MRVVGELTCYCPLGKFEIITDMYDYQGELDSQSLPCGVGTTIDEQGDQFFGTWLNGKKHGICE